MAGEGERTGVGESSMASEGDGAGDRAAVGTVLPTGVGDGAAASALVRSGVMPGVPQQADSKGARETTNRVMYLGASCRIPSSPLSLVTYTL